MLYLFKFQSFVPKCQSTTPWIEIGQDLPSSHCRQIIWLHSYSRAPPSAAYMRQWTESALVQIMACRLLGAKPLFKPSWFLVNWTLRNKLQWIFNRNTKLFIQENASENIACEMAAILSRGRWVNEFKPWFKFCLSHYSAVCNIKLYWTGSK